MTGEAKSFFKQFIFMKKKMKIKYKERIYKLNNNIITMKKIKKN